MTDEIPIYQRLDAAPVRFEDIEVGRDLGSMEWRLDTSQVQGLIENDADYQEWYLEDSPFGEPIVPPLATYPPVRLLFTRTYNLRGMFIEFTTHFIKPVFYGRDYTITGTVVGKWIKRDREYVRYEARCLSEDGSIVFTTERTHILSYSKRAADSPPA